MAQKLRSLLKVLNALTRLVPVLIDILQDLSDDGKRNHSAGGQCYWHWRQAYRVTTAALCAQ